MHFLRNVLRGSISFLWLSFYMSFITCTLNNLWLSWIFSKELWFYKLKSLRNQKENDEIVGEEGVEFPEISRWESNLYWTSNAHICFFIDLSLSLCINVFTIELNVYILRMAVPMTMPLRWYCVYRTQRTNNPKKTKRKEREDKQTQVNNRWILQVKMNRISKCMHPCAHPHNKRCPHIPPHKRPRNPVWQLQRNNMLFESSESEIYQFNRLKRPVDKYDLKRILHIQLVDDVILVGRVLCLSPRHKNGWREGTWVGAICLRLFFYKHTTRDTTGGRGEQAVTR